METDVTTTVIKSGTITKTEKKEEKKIEIRKDAIEKVYKELEALWDNIVSAISTGNSNHAYAAYNNLKKKYKKYLMKE